MITLAIGMAFFLFAQQNYAIFNGHSGFAGIAPPQLFGVNWRDPVPFYYLALFVAGALLCRRGLCRALDLRAQPAGDPRQSAPHARARLQRRRAPRRRLLRLAGLIASLAGVLLVWFDGRISPGTIGVDRLIDILVIAIVGGLRHPAGAFIGAVFFVLLSTFATDIVGAERFNTLIGVLFLAIVLFSPDGLLGLWEKARRALSRGRAARSKSSDTSGSQTEQRTGSKPPPNGRDEHDELHEDSMALATVAGTCPRPSPCRGRRRPGHAEGRAARDLRGAVHGARRGRQARR